jgi:hypothetical protein
LELEEFFATEEELATTLEEDIFTLEENFSFEDEEALAAEDDAACTENEDKSIEEEDNVTEELLWATVGELSATTLEEDPACDDRLTSSSGAVEIFPSSSHAARNASVSENTHKLLLFI